MLLAEAFQRVTGRAALERFHTRLALILAAGALVRLVLTLALVHRSFDMDSVRMVDDALRHHFSGTYLTGRWPYPGALLPWVYLSGRLSHLTGADISIWFKLPSIAADLGLAWLVQAYLGLRNAPATARLAAAALVSLGPSFIAISGYEGQIDAIAILPAVAAAYVWELGEQRPGAVRHRELIAALLIGAGGAVKTIPLLLLVVFVPRVPGWLGRARFCLVALAVPLASVVPWLVTNPHSLSLIINYVGIGVGPLMLLVQPALAKDVVLAHGNVAYNSLSSGIQRHGKLLLLAALAITGLVLLLRRVRLELAALIVWLAVYAFMPFFFFQYVIWGLPFALMCGYLRGALAAQALLLVPLIVWEARPWPTAIPGWLYAALLVVTWALALSCWIRQLVQVARSAGLSSAKASAS